MVDEKEIKKTDLTETEKKLIKEFQRRVAYVNFLKNLDQKKSGRRNYIEAIKEISRRTLDLNPPSLPTLRRWYSVYIESGNDIESLRPEHRRKGNRLTKFAGKKIKQMDASDQLKAEKVENIVTDVIKVYIKRPTVSPTKVLNAVRKVIDKENNGENDNDKLPNPHINSIYKRLKKHKIPKSKNRSRNSLAFVNKNIESDSQPKTEEKSNVLSEKELANYYNISVDDVVSLYKLGIIEGIEIVEKFMNEDYSYLFLTKNANRLILDINNGVDEDIESAKEIEVEPSELLILLTIAEIELGIFVKAILNKELSPVRKSDRQ